MGGKARKGVRVTYGRESGLEGIMGGVGWNRVEREYRWWEVGRSFV